MTPNDIETRTRKMHMAFKFRISTSNSSLIRSSTGTIVKPESLYAAAETLTRIKTAEIEDNKGSSYRKF